MEKRIYLVLTDTGTVLSRAIGLYTRTEFNHVSIAFDDQLDEMYSFGRRQEHNPFSGGFVKENTEMMFLRKARCEVHQLKVSEKVYQRIRQEVKRFEQSAEDYRYNFIGLFGFALHIPIERENAFFCSEFVATLFEQSGYRLFEESPHFIQPEDFKRHPLSQKIYRGTVESYLELVSDRLFAPKTNWMKVTYTQMKNKLISF